MRKFLFFVVVLLALVGAGIAYSYLSPLSVVTAQAVRGDAINAVYASGPVEAMNRVEIKAKVSGPIADLLVRVGQAVSKGELLAKIDAPSLGFEVERGRADLQAARERSKTAPQVAALESQTKALQAQLAQARAEETRAASLVKLGALTQQALERARTQVATLEAQIAANRSQQQDVRIALRADSVRQKAGVAALQARASDVEIAAPIDGVVLVRHVELGQMVSINENLLRVGDLRHLWIESRVDEADIGRVRVKMPAAVRLYAFPGKTFKGEVARILPEADRERKAFEVDVDLLEEVPELRPGMTAEINIIMEQHRGALLVPADAVRDGHVWVIGAGRLLKRAVEVGIRDQIHAEVLRGLDEGESVVLTDEKSLREGQRVRAQATPAPTVSRPSGS